MSKDFKLNMGWRSFKPVPRCKECNKPIRLPKMNKSGFCSCCGNTKSIRKKWKLK